MTVATVRWEGIEEAIGTFRHMGQTASKRAVGSGTSAALTVMAQHLRRHVDAASIASPNARSLKAGAKKTIGKRFIRGGTSRTGKTTAHVAKVGFGVGKTGAARNKITSRRTTQEQTRGRSVGVSAADIHWFVLGARGQPETPSFFKHAVQAAQRSSQGPATQKALAKMKLTMDREAAKAVAKIKRK